MLLNVRWLSIKLPVASLIMIMFAALCFFLYIGFNYAFHGDGGVKEALWDSANKTMSGERLSTWNSLMPQLTQGFGIACIGCMGLAIVIFLADVFFEPPDRRY